MAKDSYYFRHDNTSLTDEKLIELRMEMGFEGYGIFWAILELLHKEGGFMRTHYERIAFAITTQNDKVQRIIEGFGLFQIEGEQFSSNRMLADLNERSIKSRTNRKIALEGWEKRRKNANALPTQSEPDANALPKRKEKERKEEEKKEKEIKEKEIKEEGTPLPLEQKKIIKEKKERGPAPKFTPPTVEEVIAYFDSKGFPEALARKAWEYYTEGNWTDSKGVSVRNWKQKMISVWLREENRAGNGKDHTYLKRLELSENPDYDTEI